MFNQSQYDERANRTPPVKNAPEKRRIVYIKEISDR
jgi:hypothetical protein